MTITKQVTAATLLRAKKGDEKTVWLTAIDATSATIAEMAGADVLLVGDSLGMVSLGYDSTLPVTLNQMIHHTAAVVRGRKHAWVVCDLPFGSYQKSAEQAVVQSEAIARTEMHQRRESFLKIAEAVRAQLATIVGMLYLSSQATGTNAQVVPPEKLSELWMKAGSADPDIFSREMMVLGASSGESYQFKLFFGTEIRTRHTENFEHTFERMVRAARSCDEDSMIEDAMMGSANGALYKRIQHLRNNIPEGFTIGVYDFDPDSRED